MRMMKNNNNETVMVIGIDHGYGNMKTATRCFPSGVARYDKEPIFGLFLNLPEGSAPGTPARQWRKYSCEMSTGHSYGTFTD